MCIFMKIFTVSPLVGKSGDPDRQQNAFLHKKSLYNAEISSIHIYLSAL